MDEANRVWLKKMGPVIVVILIAATYQAVTVLRMHREGSRDDVAPLVWPAHYVVQKPQQGAFDDACVTRGWQRLAGAPPTFAAGPDRERQLGVLHADDGAAVRVSLREPAPRPTVLQIDLAVPSSDTAPSVVLARNVFATIDEACGVPYVAPAECGALPTPVCRAFRVK